MMKQLTYYLFLVAASASCAPSNVLQLEVINPARFTFPDTGNILILNASYLPSSVFDKSNIISQMTVREKQIYDTLILANVFKGLFEVLNESPAESIKNAEYFEMRTDDTVNFLSPLDPDEVKQICQNNSSDYLVSMEYYAFNSIKTQYETSWGEWEKILGVSYQINWRVYRNDGELLDQMMDRDTLYWYSDSEASYRVPELINSVREVFFLAGKKFGKRISPYWSDDSLNFYQIFSYGDDISLDREHLVELVTSKKRNQAYKACYNLAVLSESEDKLQEAVSWMDKAESIKQSETINNYRKKLEQRLENKIMIDQQTGF